MVIILSGLAIGVFWLWMVVDMFQRRREIDERFWTVVVLLLGPIGALIYFVGHYVPTVLRGSNAGGSQRLKELESQGEDRLPLAHVAELARIYRRRGRWADAERCYRRAVASLSDQHSLHLELAECLIALKRAPEAVPHLQQVIERAPYYRHQAEELLKRCGNASAGAR
jgi:hypothetical protein